MQQRLSSHERPTHNANAWWSVLTYPSICHQPNRSFNADANTGHGFAIFMASVGPLRPYGLRRRLTFALALLAQSSLYRSKWIENF
jgi:hypothetical protein